MKVYVHVHVHVQAISFAFMYTLDYISLDLFVQIYIRLQIL